MLRCGRGRGEGICVLVRFKSKVVVIRNGSKAGFVRVGAFWYGSKARYL